MTVQFLSNGADLFLWFHFRLREQFPITGENFFNLFFEVEILIALDGFVVFDPLCIELYESAGDFGGGVIRELELDLVVEQALSVV